MKNGSFMCVLIGGVLFLSQSFGLYAKGVDRPTIGVSTAELDGFNAKTKSVEMYESDFVSGGGSPSALLRSFKYDSLGRRIEYRDVTSALTYRYGYDRRGNHVRTSVYLDSIKERMRDTILFYDSYNRLVKKRISYWGEWLETEKFEYDSLGELTSRNLYSETGDQSLKRSEIYRYDAKNRMVAYVKRDIVGQTNSKTIWIYDKESDRLKKKREEENGVVVHDYRYKYDSKGKLTREEDLGKMAARVARTMYFYDLNGRLNMVRTYDQNNVWLGERTFSYHHDGKIKDSIDLKLHLVQLDEECSVNEWDLKSTSYDRYGRKTKYDHREGKGDLFAVYDYVGYVMLPDKTVLPSSLYYDKRYAQKNNIVQSDSVMTTYRREKIYVDEPEPLQMMKFVYKKGSCKRCTAYFGLDEVDLFMTYNKKKQLTKSWICDASGKVVFQCNFLYDERGNMLKRWVGVSAPSWEMNSAAPLFREHFDSVGLFDRNLVCKYEYWK